MESKSNPYWYKLIKLLKSKKIITTGLTIPYVFGAYEVLGAPFKDIDQLIISVRDSSTDKFPVIQKCPEILQHVIMTEAKEICNRYSDDDVRLASPSSGNILFISSNTNLGKTLEKVCWNLNANY